MNIKNGQQVRCHPSDGWRREELDPLPGKVWLVVCDQHWRLLFARSEEHAIERAARLAKANPGRTYYVAHATQKITQPKPVQPELIVEKL
ncbi:hypothetical protein D9M71_805980 [compost metagenome]